jgi:uncharacterized membrane protein
MLSGQMNMIIEIIARGLEVTGVVVAADIIRTVLIDPSIESIMALGLLVMVRILLGWSIAVEIEGCWPWQVQGKSVSSD